MEGSDDLPDLMRLKLSNGHQKKLENKAILTGKQEHYLKRELISQQVRWEISDLATPTALQRFGAPFRSDRGEVEPVDSELPILRYIFVNHVRNFPFLDKAKEKEFWQDRLQVFLESFAIKRISSSEDRLEETKRRKLALKCEKLVELMMNSGIKTASGYEERITFNEIEVVDRHAQEEGLHLNVPEGYNINDWDVNVVAVRKVGERRTVRTHYHPHYLIRSKREGEAGVFVARRYRDFVQLHRSLRSELPGKTLPSVPRKDHSGQELDSPHGNHRYPGGWDDTASIDSGSSSGSSSSDSARSSPSSTGDKEGNKERLRNSSRGSNLLSIAKNKLATVSSTSLDSPEPTTLWRETQRISLRAYLRTSLGDPQVAKSSTMRKFLTDEPTTLSDHEKKDAIRRKEMDHQRVEEQKRFYEAARQRARELDVYMESFRRDIVENNGLTKLFAEIRQKQKLQDLSVNYQKFAEWLRIEVAATIYHIFLAEDNSPELFAQLKRVHSLMPYTILKNIIRITNPAVVMSGVLDLFMATPFKSRSLLQRIIGMALHDGIRQLQKSIDVVIPKINDEIFCAKLKQYVYADNQIRDTIQKTVEEDQIDLIVAILQSDQLAPVLRPDEIERAFNAWVAWNSAVENVDEEMKNGAQLFSYMKQLLKLYTRQRDKEMMQAITEEPVSLQLFRDLFMIFYDPLIRVYKSANVYNSVTDFAQFIDDMIQVVEKARRQGKAPSSRRFFFLKEFSTYLLQPAELASDPNQIVQSFIDLCKRHEDNFYKFVHEVHVHDNGLFEQLMGWLEGILQFLREGPKAGPLDMNKLFEDGIKRKLIDEEVAKKEINNLIEWHAARKRWHENKTRQKMANTEPIGWTATGPEHVFRGSDFGIDEDDLDDLAYIDDNSEEEHEAADDDTDPLEAERRRRARNQDILRRRAGEPAKPAVQEIYKLGGEFVSALRAVLAQ